MCARAHAHVRALGLALNLHAHTHPVKSLASLVSSGTSVLVISAVPVPF